MGHDCEGEQPQEEVAVATAFGLMTRALLRQCLERDRRKRYCSVGVREFGDSLFRNLANIVRDWDGPKSVRMECRCVDGNRQPCAAFIP